MNAPERSALEPKALIVGLAVGALAALSNLHVSLRTGWSLPVMTTAALVALGVARDRPKTAAALTALVSAAGYMAGGGNAAALPALIMLGGTEPRALWVVGWWIVVAALGTLIAPLFRPKTIDLAFPTATATAALLALPGEATRKIRALGLAALVGALVGTVRQVTRLPAAINAPGILGRLTFGVDTSVVLVGAGALMAPRTALSSLAGAIATYGVLGPWLLSRGLVPEASYRAFVPFMVWPSAALLVAASITELALDLRTLARASAFESLPRARLALLGVLSLAAMAIAKIAFDVPLVATLASLPVAIVIAFVATRAMGETDVVPTKALAPLAQLGFAALPAAAGGGLATVAIAPNLTSAAAIHAADTIGSLKVARAHGLSARVVLAARLAGCGVGAFAVYGGYRVLVPDARALPTAELPVPAVLVWKSVTEVLARGVGGLGAASRVAIVVAAVVGIALVVLERALPKRWAAWVPSAAGLASGMVLPASSSVSIAMGAALGGRLRTHAVPVASGLVAGESVITVLFQVTAALLRVV